VARRGKNMERWKYRFPNHWIIIPIMITQGCAIRRHPWLSSVWKQPRSPEPMEPECNNPQSHWSQLVKGSNPLPPGDPIWALKVPLWLPYAPLMPPLRQNLDCANVACPRDDFHWFSMLSIDFQCFSLFSNHFQWFSLISKDVQCFFNDFLKSLAPSTDQCNS